MYGYRSGPATIRQPGDRALCGYRGRGSWGQDSVRQEICSANASKRLDAAPCNFDGWFARRQYRRFRAGRWRLLRMLLWRASQQGGLRFKHTDERPRMGGRYTDDDENGQKILAAAEVAPVVGRPLYRR